MELQDWRKNLVKTIRMNSNFVWWNWHHNLELVLLGAREKRQPICYFQMAQLWQNEGRVFSRRLPVTTSSDTGVELLPVEITPDEQKEPVAAIAPSLSTSTQTRVSASSCR
ncbi:hypothetical protein [Klebsiella pneumoniae]|uniref:hypothetical protein n=1 Tax=Klebsiella pneumoniae TaxID=573 RepID=UPI00294A98DF|nr:hypothetical protein [Klebsiella pneumoniae]MDV5417885.1 hypothetical protein [Klebsiella pneumoniae]